MMVDSRISEPVCQVAGRLWLRASILHRQWRVRRRPDKEPRILVVGALRAGGSGKTDWVDWIAYRHPERAILVHPTGDEDRLLESRHPGRVFRNRDLLQAWAAAERAGFRGAVSDGGLQDPALDGCPAILLGESEAGSEGLLPFGPYRERRPSRSIDLVLPEGSGWRWRSRLDLPAGGRVLVAAGVARTEIVVSDLERLGFLVADVLPARDHARFRAAGIARLEREHGCLPWVVTAKDEARGDLAAFGRPVHILRRELEVSDHVAGRIDALLSA